MKPLIIFGDNINLSFGDELLHISDFLKISPTNSTSQVIKSFFPGYHSRISIDDEVNRIMAREKNNSIDYQQVTEIRRYSNDSEKDTLMYGFEGDPSNYWNID